MHPHCIIVVVFGIKRKSAPAAPVADTTEQGLEHGLQKTRQGLFGRLFQRLAKHQPLDEVTLEELEDRLVLADVGMESCQMLIARLRQCAAHRVDQASLCTQLRTLLLEELRPVAQDWQPMLDRARPSVILMVGVNGVGKTTTIGKLAHRLLASGHRVHLAAGDTFRAAAVEQLVAWGERNQVPVSSRPGRADAGAVIYDALQSARDQGAEILIADTAGRLHTNVNLMEELRKIRRVISRFDPDIPVMSMLTLDAGTGNNALAQARAFDAAVGVDWLILSKLDGTAKGGLIFALARQIKKPVAFIGIGESIADLCPFQAEEFVDALLRTDVDTVANGDSAVDVNAG